MGPVWRSGVALLLAAVLAAAALPAPVSARAYASASASAGVAPAPMFGADGTLLSLPRLIFPSAAAPAPAPAAAAAAAQGASAGPAVTPAPATAAATAAHAGAGAAQLVAPAAPSTATASAHSSAPAGAAAGAAPRCVTLTETSSESCAGGACCAIKQRVTSCPDHTTALFSVNGAQGACCVVLANKRSGRPAAFCATPEAKWRGARTFPPGVAITLHPECTAGGPNGAPAASVSCTATFPELPRGFGLPPASLPAITYAGTSEPWSASGLAPCGHGAFQRFSQAITLDKGSGAATFTVTCSA
jgi:hypothetical protein